MPPSVHDDRLFAHRVNASDVLISANAEWWDFARENAAAQLSEEAVLGRSLWQFIADADTRGILRLVLARARSGQKPAPLPFRCDSPELRRFMTMEVSALGNGEVEFKCRIARLEVRPRIELLEPPAGCIGRLLRICGWCKKVASGQGHWLEVEEAIASDEILSHAPPPTLTHGICPACASALLT